LLTVGVGIGGGIGIGLDALGTEYAIPIANPDPDDRRIWNMLSRQAQNPDLLT
jgi:hypothetical protein